MPAVKARRNTPLPVDRRLTEAGVVPVTAKRRQLVTSSTYVSNYTVSYSMEFVLEADNSTAAMQDIFTYIRNDAFDEIKQITLVAIDEKYLDEVASAQLTEQGHFIIHPREHAKPVINFISHLCCYYVEIDEIQGM